MKTYFKKIVELTEKEYDLLQRIFENYTPSELEDDFVSSSEKAKMRKLYSEMVRKVTGLTL